MAMCVRSLYNGSHVPETFMQQHPAIREQLCLISKVPLLSIMNVRDKELNRVLFHSGIETI
jgi:hypothetical protein